VGWAGYEAGEMKNVYKILDKKLKGRDYLQRPRQR
jgi:hypothetical protein